MTREPIGRSIPPVGRKDRLIGAASFFVLAILATWIATGTAPTIVAQLGLILSWAMVAVLFSHIAIVLYFWRSAGTTADNPYAHAPKGGSRSRTLMWIGRACALVFVAALVAQGRIVLPVILVALAAANWYLQLRIVRASTGNPG